METLKQMFGEHYTEAMRRLLYHVRVFKTADWEKKNLNELKRARGANAACIAVVVKLLQERGIVLPLTRAELEFKRKAPELWELDLGMPVNNILAARRIYSIKTLLAKKPETLKSIFLPHNLAKMKKKIPQLRPLLQQISDPLLRLKLGSKIMSKLSANKINTLDKLMALDVDELYSFYGKDRKAVDIILRRLQDPKYL